MSERRSRVLPTLLGCAVFVVASGALCCCGSCGFAVVAPKAALSYLAGTVASPTPLPIPPPPADAEAHIGELLSTCSLSQAGAAATFTTEQVNLFTHAGERSADTQWTLRDREGLPELMLSAEMEPGSYLNVTTRFELRMEQGWLTTMRIHHLEVGSWNLSPYLNQDLSAEMNKRLTESRQEDPDVAEGLDAIVLAAAQGTTWSLQLDPASTGYAKLCGASDELAPAAPE